MAYLMDTNIVIRFIQPHHPSHSVARNAINVLKAQGEQINLTAQTIIEFWNVLTRPTDKNGFGYRVKQALEEVNELTELFDFVPETTEEYPIWLNLASKYSVSGKQVHDARLVAVMEANNLSHILTFNTADFHRYKEITAISPHDL